jgi:hypothetical protein
MESTKGEYVGNSPDDNIDNPPKIECYFTADKAAKRAMAKAMILTRGKSRGINLTDEGLDALDAAIYADLEPYSHKKTY